MAVNMCHLYNDSHLDKLNGFVFSNPHANVTLQSYDAKTGRCGNFTDMPMNVYFPMVFNRVHHCSAAIPVWSSIGTDHRVSITGYGDLLVMTQSVIKEITFIYTQPYNDCTLKLDSMIMLDIQCVGKVNYFPSPWPTSTDSSITSDVTEPSTSNPVPTTTITRSSYFDDDRYTRITGIPGKLDSYNNPLYHLESLRVCPVKHPKYKIIFNRATYKHAHLVCLRKGMRLAAVRREDMGEMIGLIGSCLGADQSVWVRSYWRGESKPNRCLQLTSGSTPGQGSVSVASSCNKEQAVICEEAYLTADA